MNLPMENNYELIQEGGTIISNYVKTQYNKSYPEDVVNAVHNYLTSESMLAHIAKHIGLKDLILSNVSKMFTYRFKIIQQLF